MGEIMCVVTHGLIRAERKARLLDLVTYTQDLAFIYPLLYIMALSAYHGCVKGQNTWGKWLLQP
jgi:hypothetical protein